MFDAFVTELKKAVKSTDYKEKDEMVRDRIVMGIRDKSTQEKLLREADLTLEKAINFCRAVEISKSQSKVLQNESLVSAVDKKSNPGRSKGVYVKEEEIKNQCVYCGLKHVKGRCPAYGKTCNKCQRKNHFAEV